MKEEDWLREKEIYEILLQGIAHSCAIGAWWLEEASKGEGIANPETLYEVAGGLKEAVRDIDYRKASILIGIKQLIHRYFTQELWHNDYTKEEILSDIDEYERAPFTPIGDPASEALPYRGP